jgi:hypothetical protein
LEGNELSLFRLAREGISEEETSEMRPDRWEGVNQATDWKNIIPSNRNREYKNHEAEKSMGDLSQWWYSWLWWIKVEFYQVRIKRETGRQDHWESHRTWKGL